MSKTIRFGGLLVYVLLACGLVWLLRPTYLLSLLLIFYIPALITLCWLKHNQGKVLLFSFLALLFFAPPVELLARAANAWQVQTLFPQLLGLIPLENMLFAFVNFFWALSLYEYFTANDQPFKISRRIWVLLALYLALDLATFAWFFLGANFTGLDYHLLALPILVVPFVLLFYRRPKLFFATLKSTGFVFVALLVYEAIAVILGHWWWPGHYLWPINWFGHTLPLDDVVIWYLLSTPVLVGGYEYFFKGYSENIQN